MLYYLKRAVYSRKELSNKKKSHYTELTRSICIALSRVFVFRNLHRLTPALLAKKRQQKEYR